MLAKRQFLACRLWLTRLCSCCLYCRWLRILEIVKRPLGSKGFVVVAKRWIVERTFAWLSRNRRLSKDYERSVMVSETWVRIAMIQHMVRRLAAIQEYLPNLCRIVSAASDGFAADTRSRKPSWTLTRFISANARLVSAVRITRDNCCMSR